MTSPSLNVKFEFEQDWRMNIARLLNEMNIMQNLNAENT